MITETTTVAARVVIVIRTTMGMTMAAAMITPMTMAAGVVEVMIMAVMTVVAGAAVVETTTVRMVRVDKALL